MLLPWPDRQQRRAAIASAEAEKHRSVAGAAHAADLGRDIARRAEANHFAGIIADQIIRNAGGRP